jgi:hypothetical protein
VADKCACGKEYDPVCDYKQGRCPSHPPLIKLKEPMSEETVNHPDPKLHKYISFAKSGLRIVAGGCLYVGNLPIAGIFFIVAEALGVVEEMV